MSELTFQDEINALNKEAQLINEQIMKANIKLENHQENYKNALRIAEEKFGTDDFDELVKIAQQRAESNDKKKEEYKSEILKKKEEIQKRIQLENDINQSLK